MLRTSTSDRGEKSRSAPEGLDATLRHLPNYVASLATFRECVRFCARDMDFVDQFEADRGRDLHRYGLPIDLLVDEHNAASREDVKAFAEAVYRQVWPYFSGEVTISDILSR